ncbi:MAG: hypothetical protein JXA36_03155 [Coriobacteriia bacterium]|nr:hypothetical protein [Coriobacteriia bacterium]
MTSVVPAPLLVPACITLVGVVLVLMADSLGRRRLSIWLGAFALAAAGGSAFMYATYGAAVVSSRTFTATAGFTALGGLIYLLTASSVVAGYSRFSEIDRGPTMVALMALGSLFAHLLLSSLDLIVLFVTLAGLAVIGYALIAGAGTPRAEESAMRYFIQGTIATGLTVYGLALLLGAGGGGTSYAIGLLDLTQGGSGPALVSLALVVSVLGFKVGAFPFHSWVPDAYENADAPVAAYLGSVPKIAGIVALLIVVRATVFSAPAFEPARNMLMMLASGSLLFGSFGMLRQRSVGRLLGYSAVAQVGFALVAVAGSSLAVNATVTFVVTYAIGACAAFVALEAVRRVRPGWDGSLEGLAGLSRQAPLLAGCLAVAMLSLTGMPLFAGFWGKFAVFSAAIEADLLGPALVAAVAAVVSFGGYGAVIRWMYFERSERDDPAPEEREHGGSALVVTVVLAALLVVLGVVPLAVSIWPMSGFFGT